MATQKQIEANRRNARKSTGPRTDAGKAKSKLNPLKHGLTAETVVLPFESAADYDALKEAIVNDLQPQSVTEQILAERFAHKHWLSQRLARTERGWLDTLYKAHLEAGQAGAKNPKESPDPYEGLAICMLQAPGEDPKDRLHQNFFRYRAAIENDFQRAIRALERNKIGFVSQPPAESIPEPQRPALTPIHRTPAEPLERSPEQEKVVLLPKRVV